MTTQDGSCGGCRNSRKLPFSIVMAYQPIIDMKAARVWGYEALVRGTNGESAGAILTQVTDEDRYKFDQLCRVKAIEGAGELFRDPDACLSINFMPNAVYEPAACIRTSLIAAERVGFARERIMFEFTEDERVRDHQHIKHIVEEYKRFGFLTAIDDFGAGYAGLNLLANFQPNIVKIDMALIRDIEVSVARQTIVAAIVTIARGLDLTVLAEGIETKMELALCRAAGIDLFQGYLFAKPMIGRLPDIAPGFIDNVDPGVAWNGSRESA
jgi:EAL domain-containing protein (putative c-di-GMP-specific phosphodiesterase class I)